MFARLVRHERVIEGARDKTAGKVSELALRRIAGKPGVYPWAQISAPGVSQAAAERRHVGTESHSGDDIEGVCHSTKIALPVRQIPQGATTLYAFSSQYPFGGKGTEPRVFPGPVKAKLLIYASVVVLFNEPKACRPPEFSDSPVAVKGDCVSCRVLFVGAGHCHSIGNFFCKSVGGFVAMKANV